MLALCGAYVAWLGFRTVNTRRFVGRGQVFTESAAVRLDVFFFVIAGAGIATLALALYREHRCP